MRVLVNGAEAEVEAGATVLAVLAAHDIDASTRGVAVAVDAEVVPRGDWPRTRVAEGARVEILHAVQGG